MKTVLGLLALVAVLVFSGIAHATPTLINDAMTSVTAPLQLAAVTPALTQIKVVPTTAEQQLAGCPTAINLVPINGGKSNAFSVDHTNLSRSCWSSLYGDQGGGGSAGDDDDNS